MSSSIYSTIPSYSADAIAQALHEVRAQNPLVLNLTNLVVMQTTANALLALGTAPIMSNAKDELADLIGIANSLVVNIGTLHPRSIDMMQHAMPLAQQRGIPCILDPVGVGASQLRTKTARQLCELAPSVIRGNASEIMALADSEQRTKGVDSVYLSRSALGAAQALVQQYGCVVVISGAQDIIVTDQQIITIDNGHALMARVTGTGCTATACIGAFLAVLPSAAQAAVAAMAVIGIAGELAAQQAEGPGSWSVHFLDMLYQLDHQLIKQHLRLTLAK